MYIKVYIFGMEMSQKIHSQFHIKFYFFFNVFLENG